MEIIYFALGLVIALVVAEVLAWFSVIKVFNRYSKNITDIQIKNEELIRSSKEELQLLNLRVDNLENQIYRDIDEVHTRIGSEAERIERGIDFRIDKTSKDIDEVHTRISSEVERIERGIDSRMDKFDLKLKKDLLKG